MALTMMTNDKKQVYTACKVLHLKAATIGLALDIDKHCEIKSHADEVLVTYGELIMGTIPLGLSVWHKILEGKMTSDSAKSLVSGLVAQSVHDIHSMLDTVLATEMAQTGGSDDPDFTPVSVAGAMYMGPAAPKQVTYIPSTYAEITDTPCALGDATALRQPVRGSDSTSVYFCVAIGTGVNLGVRIKPNLKASIRVEGPKIQDYVLQLANAGLSAAGSGHYSTHLEGKNKELVRKTIGSLLYATGIQWTAVMTDIDQLIGEGA